MAQKFINGDTYEVVLTAGADGLVDSAPTQNVTGNITAVGQSVFCDVSKSKVAIVFLVATGLSGHVAAFEISSDSTNGANGNWFRIQGARTDGSLAEPFSTQAISNTPVYGWIVPVSGSKWFRVRSLLHAAGTAGYTISLGDGGYDLVHASPHGVEDASALGAAFRVGGRVRTAAPTTFADSDAADLTIASSGALVVRPFAIPELSWAFSSATGGVTVNTSQTLKVAAGAGLRNYLTNLQITNASTTVSTEVVILDNVTVIWRDYLAAGSSRTVSFDSPLKSTANTALNFQALTASQIYLSGQGFRSP